jgi:hypothetical protein
MSQLGLEATRGSPSFAITLHKNKVAFWDLSNKIVAGGSGPGVRALTDRMIELAKKDNLGWEVRRSRIHFAKRVVIRVKTKTENAAKAMVKEGNAAAERINHEDLVAVASSPSNGR